MLGADLFYEYPLVDMICRLVQGMDSEGVAYLADPERSVRPLVLEHILASGVRSEKIPWHFKLNGEEQKIAIWKLCPAK